LSETIEPWDGTVGSNSHVHIYLVGGIPTPLKNMTSSVGKDDIPYILWKKKKNEPPTRYTYIPLVRNEKSYSGDFPCTSVTTKPNLGFDLDENQGFYMVFP
jgi:hypothetical protein